jgi:hypothetical protein
MGMRLRRIFAIAVLGLLGIGLVDGGLTDAAAAKKPKWSINVAGGIDGTVEAIEPTCVYSPDGETALIAEATFEVSGARFRISIAFAAPVQPGSREFGLVAGPQTVVVHVADVSDPSTSWASSGDGAGTINANRRSGFVQGTLAAVGADGIATPDGIATEVDASFECSKLSTGQSTRHAEEEQGQGRKGESSLWVGPLSATFSDVIPCTGSDEGTIAVIVRGKKATGTVAVSGSFTCTNPAIGTYTASGSVDFGVTGTFTGDDFRFRPEPPIVTTGAGPTAQCAAVPKRPIVVPVTERGTATATFEWSTPGRQATCEITLTRQ